MTALLVPEIRDLLSERDYAQLKDFFDDLHPSDIAEAISDMEPSEILEILSIVGNSRSVEVFEYMDTGVQKACVESVEPERLLGFIEGMSADERVDLVKALDEDVRERLYPLLAQAERNEIRRMIEYREGTAGAVMTTDYTSLPVDVSAEEALKMVRRQAPNKETIYYIYVVDEKRKLLGLISLKDLILARPNAELREIMDENLITADLNEDVEDVARKIAKYDLIAIPVVDSEGRLVGIVTYDDAMDIINAENTEDMQRFMGFTGTPGEASYIKVPVWVQFKRRVTWIISLAFLGLISGWVVLKFEKVLENLLILALYMPMLADTGGNTGSQSATVVVRALALGEITYRDFFRVILKELLISFLIALVLGTLAFGRVFLLSSSDDVPPGFTLLQVGFVIALALGIQVISATIIGAALPLIAARFKIDPAVVASPALTTVVDITGLLIYFTTAKLILGI
ncbi:MAG: magnesium transporter [bacterium]